MRGLTWWVGFSLLLFSGCALATKYGTMTVTMSPAEVAELYNLVMERSIEVPQIKTEDGVVVKVEE